MKKFEKIFANGIIHKTIKTKYWELKKLSFKVEEFKEFLDNNNNNWWVNIIEKTSKKTWKPYYELDTFIPKNKENIEEKDNKDKISISDIPF